MYMYVCMYVFLERGREGPVCHLMQSLSAGRRDGEGDGERERVLTAAPNKANRAVHSSVLLPPLLLLLLLLLVLLPLDTAAVVVACPLSLEQRERRERRRSTRGEKWLAITR